MKFACSLVLALALSVPASAWLQVSGPQDKPVVNPHIVDLPIEGRRFARPKLPTLRQALDKAEAFISKERIDTGGYYLEEAKIIYAAEPENTHWYFRWMNDRGVIGDYINIHVFRNGEVGLTPSM
jgi:hypothetical protein